MVSMTQDPSVILQAAEIDKAVYNTPHVLDNNFDVRLSQIVDQLSIPLNDLKDISQNFVAIEIFGFPTSVALRC